MIFPQSNLPIDAQPWAREITKQLSSLIDQVSSNEVNNAARDNQLNSSIIAASAAATRAENAVQGLIDLGQSGSGYTVNADNITAGTISGATYEFLDSSNNPLAFMFSSSTSLYISYATVPDISAGNIIILENDRVYTRAGSGNSSSMELVPGGATLSGYSSVTIQATQPGASLTVSSTGTSAGRLNASGAVWFTGIGSSTSTANVRRGAEGQILESTASSARFKHDIVSISENDEIDPRKLLDIDIYSYKYNDEYLDANDQRYKTNLPGFVVEQMFEHYPVAVDLDGENKPKDWNFRFIIPGMLALIQNQEKRITELEGRLNG